MGSGGRVKAWLLVMPLLPLPLAAGLNTAALLVRGVVDVDDE